MTFARETWVVFVRCVRINLRNRVWFVVGLSQPILYLALFGPLLEKIVAGRAGLPPGDAWQIFVPGLLVQLGMFGAAFVGFGLLAEHRAGVLERQRVTPASRLALLIGRVLQEVATLVIQALILIGVAIPFGLRAPLAGVLLSLLIVAGLTAAFSSLSYAAALRLKSEDALAPLLESLTIPMLLLPGILLPMSLAPRWLQYLSDANPVKHVVDVARSFFQGDIATWSSFWGLFSLVALVGFGLWFGTATFRRESA